MRIIIIIIFITTTFISISRGVYVSRYISTAKVFVTEVFASKASTCLTHTSCPFWDKTGHFRRYSCQCDRDVFCLRKVTWSSLTTECQEVIFQDQLIPRQENILDQLLQFASHFLLATLTCLPFL